uniref:Reverse transcriptase domain-containing protein n=1 Tax=Tanacetum cinerariifolium TaxID=118510 RepID=A0A6L2KGB0_TANCI|nr:reverse transcriptase domain-containing protein [Tanacetum cinerariifolium]
MKHLQDNWKQSLNTDINWNAIMEQVKKSERLNDAVMKYQALKRKPLTEAQARKNMIIYLKNMVGFKMNYFKGVTYSEIRPLFEKHFNYNQDFLEEVNEEVTLPKKEVEVEAHKREGESLEKEVTKKQNMDEEAENLKSHLQIVANDDDDSLWKLVKERFEKTEPKTYSDDYLLKTLRIMFEQPDVEASVWRDQKGRYGLAKRYPLTQFTLEQMLNNVRLEVKEVREMSLELSRGSPSLLKKEPPHSILTWEDLVSKFINEFFPLVRTTNLRNEIFNFQQRFDESFHEAWDRYKDLLHVCPHHGFTELHQLDTFYNALNPADKDSLNSAAGGNLLERRTQDVLTIIENKSKVRNSRNKSIVSQVKSSDANSSSSFEIAKLTHEVNQQTSGVTTTMTVILRQFQATPPLAFVKSVEEICFTCGGAHLYYQCLTADGNTFLEFRDNIQGYVSAAAVNYNQGNSGYRPMSVANQI